MAGETAVPPEALLIRRARQARRMTPEDAAPIAGVIKSRRWRQIEQGQRADDLVLAHMARAVGAGAGQLEEAGRGEAAEVLREIVRQEAREQAPDLPGGIDLSALSPKEQRDLIAAARVLADLVAKAEREEGRRGA